MNRAVVQIPGYSIDGEIGRGGMAHVYLAVQESVDRRVALKVMSPVLLVDPTFSGRFMREARIAANLNHTGVVSVYDVGLHENHHYIAMEYMPGGDLASRCARGMSVEEGLRVIREIAAALDYAHSRGFVHRDVKPENILFRDSGAAVLTDFGIARAVDSATQMTKTGAVIGTPQYMSPEQARGQELDGRSDLYGLGIVMYEVLTGKVPFEGADSVSVGIKHVTEPVPTLPEHLSGYQSVLNRFLAKDPADRFQTGDEAVQALEDLRHRLDNPLDRTVATPAPILDASRGGDAKPGPAPAGEVSVSATPRPDGSLRREPSLGSIDQIQSFDRTVGQPRLSPRGRKRSRWPAWVAVLAVLAAAGWWQKDRWLPATDPDGVAIRLLEEGVEAESAGRWYGADDSAAVLYRRVLERDPGNRAAAAGLQRVGEELLDQARQAAAAGNREQARMLLDRARQFDSGAPAELADPAPDATAAPAPPQPEPFAEPAVPEETERERLSSHLADAMDAIRMGRRTGPDDDNAAAHFQAMLALDPDNEAALAGLERIGRELRDEIERALREEAVDAAEARIAELVHVVDNEAELDGYRQAAGRLRDQLAERERQERERRNLITGLLDLGDAAFAADRLSTPETDSALFHYGRVLEIDPGNAAAREGLARVAGRYMELAEQSLEADRLDEAERYIETTRGLDPGHPGLERAGRRLALYREQRQRNRLTAEEQRQISEFLAQADGAYRRDELLAPPGRSAYDLYKSILRLDPRHPEATAGLRRVGNRLVDRAREALDRDDLNLAFGWLGDARETDPQNPRLPQLSRELAAALRQGVGTAIGEGRLDDAETLLRRASDLEPEHPELAPLQLRLNIARE